MIRRILDTMPTKRGIFWKVCMDRRLSLETVKEYTDQIRGKPDEEKERMAEAFTKEIKEKYPLP